MSEDLQWFGPDSADEPDSEHMHCDADMFARAEHGSPPTVRCYRWRAPAATIGRHQSEEAVRIQFKDLPIYRRPTGGRAVRHGDDLTVCLAVGFDGAADSRRGRAGILCVYDALVAPMAAALEDFGVLTARGNGYGSELRTIVGEDCFAHASGCDVIDAKRGIKIIGSALRRSRWAVLLQMSVRPLPDCDVHSRVFIDQVRSRYERCISRGCWNVIEG